MDRDIEQAADLVAKEIRIKASGSIPAEGGTLSFHDGRLPVGRGDAIRPDLAMIERAQMAARLAYEKHWSPDRGYLYALEAAVDAAAAVIVPATAEANAALVEAMTEPRPGVGPATSTAELDLEVIRARWWKLQITSVDYIDALVAEVDRLRADLADAQRERDDARCAVAQLQAALDGAIRLNRVLGGDLPQGPLEQILADLSAGGTGPTEGDKQ